MIAAFSDLFGMCAARLFSAVASAVTSSIVQPDNQPCSIRDQPGPI